MNILSIETSCDETAVSFVRADGDFPNATYTVLGNALRSQIDLHRVYGGVFPNLAKRDHAAIIVPLLTDALTQASMLESTSQKLTALQKDSLSELLAREPGLAEQLITFHETHGVPQVDAVAVTVGPGLEPALWVGVNFARALSQLWNVPVIPANHLEGHILASTFIENKLAELAFPAVALLISGGHTEFLLMRDWTTYEKIGQTRDDAVGEAFDKVARLLGLPYPGGPEISRLAEEARTANYPRVLELTRPMLDSGDLDVSFSGIKTAVRYAVQDQELTHEIQCAIAREFEDAVTEVLVAKARTAIDRVSAQTLILGGGVSANRHIRDMFRATLEAEYPDLALYIPDPSLTTDNSVMIALAGHAHAASAKLPDDLDSLRAEGNKQHRRIPLGENAF
ncbi:MAG: tRNA (adenosine(37)-N6)-threonylcarbamoyltransferase complex transferase subunit TsaD [Candidatus Paceibacterota bacterium]